MAHSCSASPVLDPCYDDGRLPVTAKMTDNLEAPDRVDRIEQKLERLDEKVTSIDTKIDEILRTLRR